MKKILLIEDNEAIRDNTAEILELTNYKVYTAENGKKGVETALKEKPDLIICDIMMPVLDGYGVLHMLHKNSDTKNIPFIFLTAKTERNDLRKGMELGADDYITKPFSGMELLSAVESRLKKMDVIKEEYNTSTHALQEQMNQEKGTDLLQQLVNERNINKYRRKQLVFSEGNRPSCLYFVQKGKVKTFKTNEDGKELVVGLYSEGDFLGYVALLEESNYKESAEAMEPTELSIIPKDDFTELINNHPQVNRQFNKLMAKDITENEAHLLGMAYNSLRKKVANALVILCKKYNKEKTENFHINISRENLATIAGTATESLIRTLSDFKNEKLIDIKDGEIIILNEKKLSGLLN
jgi:CRP/FNR family transcriptional regulator, cyclic AMP receptor protein